MGRRTSLAQARRDAFAVMDIIRPGALRAMVAGSVRRSQHEVGDIDILCIAKIEPVTGGLFGEVVEERNLLLEVIADCPELRRERNPGATKQIPLLYRGRTVELHVVTPEGWGIAAAIKTGPADYSKRLVTPARFGGLLPDGFAIGNGWRLMGMDEDGQVATLDTPEEADFYRLTGINWQEPEDRA